MALHFKLRGFSLSEVLIAIALLGVLSLMAIPQVMQAANNVQKHSTLSDTLSAIEAMRVEGAQSGSIHYDTFKPYFLSYFNFLKTCPSSALNDGCWIGSTDDPGTQSGNAAVIFHTGAYVLDIENSFTATDRGEALTIDWNGPKTPNKLGEDQLKVVISWENYLGPGNNGYQIGLAPYTGTPKDTYVSPGMTALQLQKNKALWDSLF